VIGAIASFGLAPSLTDFAASALSLSTTDCCALRDCIIESKSSGAFAESIETIDLLVPVRKLHQMFSSDVEKYNYCPPWDRAALFAGGVTKPICTGVITVKERNSESTLVF